VGVIEYDSVNEFWRKHVPAYQSKSLRSLLARFPYAGVVGAAKRISEISVRRSTNRVANYVDPKELDRVFFKLHGRIRSKRVHDSGGDGVPSRKGSSRADKAPADVRARPRRDVSIRFGVAKEGHGYNGERGDFCLIGGVYGSGTLTLFYRSLELIGGFAYDLVLIAEVCRQLEIEPRYVEIWATKAFVFALKGNSNEKLYPKLKGIFRGD
jgi:hypothetical protein